MREEPVVQTAQAEIDKGGDELMSLFNEVGYFERLRLMFQGLDAPKDSREYKVARIEMQRLAAPLTALFVPLVCVLLLVVLAVGRVSRETPIEVRVVEVEETRELEKVRPPPEVLPETDVRFDSNLDLPNVPVNDAPMTAQPQTHDAVLNVRSPVVLRGIFGSTRNAGMRGQMLARGGGDAATEAAALRALRWLKHNQNPEGWWPQNRVAMTSFALLTFLAHGEKPGESREFGETVQKAIEYLIQRQPEDGRFRGNYEHVIAAFALCEAYGMTQNPNVRVAAEKAIGVVIAGQHPTGGWDYEMRQSDRADTSVMAWAAQALKAAQMANVYTDVDKLNRAMRLAVRGFQMNASPSGGFGYTAPGACGMSPLGVLSMQLLGAGNRPEAQRTLAMMDAWVCSWAAPVIPQGHKGNPQYYFYYLTQAKFHAGGEDRWGKWNTAMKREYLKAQIIIPKERSGYLDPDGNPQDIGYWVNSDRNTDRPVMDTCFAALQLMVYYRYLPTFQEEAIKVDEEIIQAIAVEAGDIKVDAGNL